MLSASYGGEASDNADVPMWATVFGILVLSSPPRVTLPLLAGVGVITIAFMLLPIGRRVHLSGQQSKRFGREGHGRGRARSTLVVAARARALGTMTIAAMTEADNAIDLFRLDDDGG